MGPDTRYGKAAPGWEWVDELDGEWRDYVEDDDRCDICNERGAEQYTISRNDYTDGEPKRVVSGVSNYCRSCARSVGFSR